MLVDHQVIGIRRALLCGHGQSLGICGSKMPARPISTSYHLTSLDSIVVATCAHLPISRGRTGVRWDI